MQLPREQLKELIDKQPSIKPALYQYVVQKAGVAKAQSLADVSAKRFELSVSIANQVVFPFSSLATTLNHLTPHSPSAQSLSPHLHHDLYV